MRIRAVLLLIALCVFSTSNAYAQKRVALVLGVGNYSILGPLRSSSNDAHLIGKFLSERGFSLVGNKPLVDLTKQEFDRYIEQFGDMARNAEVAILYYSGHGMQLGGTNYLIPADSPYVTPNNIAFRFVNMDTVMSMLDRSGARLKIVLLDACRNNPFIRDGKSDPSSTGLAQMNASSGTIIGFATQPGNVAADGTPWGNSPYTAALYDAARQAGHNQFRVFNEAALRVMRNSGGKQQPWMSASPITEDFFFTPPVVASVTTSPATQGMAEVMPAPAMLPPVVIPASLPPMEATVSLDYVQRANAFFMKYDYAGGRAILTEGINAGQNTAIMYSRRGFAWFQDGQRSSSPHEALTFFRAGFPDLDAAIALERTYPNSYRHRGNMIMATWKALKKTGQRTNQILDKAIEDLENAARLDPNSMTNAYFLGESYNLRGRPGDYDTAIRWFRRALEIRPKFVAPHSGLCYAYRMKGDLASARQAAAIAAKGDSNQQDQSCLTKLAWERYVPPF